MLRLHSLPACIVLLSHWSVQQCAGSPFIQETVQRTGRCFLGRGRPHLSVALHALAVQLRAHRMRERLRVL